MPKVILEFDYYEDKEEYESMLKSHKAITALYDIQNMIRSYHKYDTYDDKTTDDFIEDLEEVIAEARECLI